MKLETGLIVVVVALAIFYLRLMQLRGRKRRLTREKMLARTREANRKKGKVPPLSPRNANTPPFQITSWILVIIAVGLMLFGTAIRSAVTFDPLIETYWYVPTAVGILLFTFCFKVEV